MRKFILFLKTFTSGYAYVSKITEETWCRVISYPTECERSECDTVKRGHALLNQFWARRMPISSIKSSMTTRTRVISK